MAKTKNKQTFASRAKAIQNKYKDLKDSISQESMEMELQALMKEQEAVRENMGLNNESQEFACGGKKKQYAYAGEIEDDSDYSKIFNTVNENIYNISPYQPGEGVLKRGLGREVDINRLNNQLPKTNNKSVPSNKTVNNNIETPKETPDLMGLRVGDRVFTRNNENMGVRSGGLFASGVTPTVSVTANTNPINTDLEINKLNSYANTQKQKALGMQDTWWNRNKQYMPSIASGISNIASNLLLANASKNVPKVSAVQATPQKINMEPQAEQLRKNAATSRNIALRNARNLGLNAGSTMANIGTATAGIDRGLGANLTNLYGQQEQFNVGAANQANLANQAAISRANIYNTQLQNQAMQDRLGYLGAAAGTIPGVMQDIRLQNRDDAQMEMWNRYMSQPKGHYKYTASPFSGPFQTKVRG